MSLESLKKQVIDYIQKTLDGKWKPDGMFNELFKAKPTKAASAASDDEADGAELTDAGLKAMTVANLKTLCKSMSLKQTGTKNELIERILGGDEQPKKPAAKKGAAPAKKPAAKKKASGDEEEEEDSTDGETYESLKAMTMDTLKTMLRDKKMKVSGKKDDLVNRLLGNDPDAYPRSGAGGKKGNSKSDISRAQQILSNDAPVLMAKQVGRKYWVVLDDLIVDNSDGPDNGSVVAALSKAKNEDGVVEYSESELSAAQIKKATKHGLQISPDAKIDSAANVDQDENEEEEETKVVLKSNKTKVTAAVRDEAEVKGAKSRFVDEDEEEDVPAPVAKKLAAKSKTVLVEDEDDDNIVDQADEEEEQ